MEEMVNLCPTCGQEVEYLTPSCSSCGCELEWGEAPGLSIMDMDYVVCEQCKREIARGSRFCSLCGAQQIGDGFVSYTQDRVLPKCPGCGEDLDWGASLCDACGQRVEWKTTQELLIDLNALKVRDNTGTKVKPRIDIDYPKADKGFDSINYSISGTTHRAAKLRGFKPPTIQYNSLGVYSD